MRLANPLAHPLVAQFFESLLPDLILAFTFFTALAYAILSKRFDHQRSAVAMSSVVGLALSIGLVWWEHDRGWSVRDLGPLAIGFAVILLGMIMYQAVRQTGGSWAGAGIAIGASVLVASILGFPWPAAGGIIPALAVVAVIVGIVAFTTHSQHTAAGVRYAPVANTAEAANVRHDMRDLYRDRRVGEGIDRSLVAATGEADVLTAHPGNASYLMAQLRQILPAEGWLTERLAHLRARAHDARKGYVSRIHEIKHIIRKLPIDMKKQASRELSARYDELHLDTRIERLDKAVAKNERRIRELTLDAGHTLVRGDYHKLTDLLKSAEKLQGHNDKLLKIIDRTEGKLADIVQGVAKDAQKVNDA